MNHTCTLVTLQQAVIIVTNDGKNGENIKAFKCYTSVPYARKNVYLVKSYIKKIPMIRFLSLYMMVQIGC